MSFASIDWLSISINLLLVIFVIVCLLMILMILMQRPKQEGLGAAFGGGVTDQVFGARTTNVLQRSTVYLGSAFFIISLLLAVLIGHQNKGLTLTKTKEAKVEEKAPAAPATPETPKSLVDELPKSATTDPVETPPPAAVVETTPDVSPSTPPVVSPEAAPPEAPGAPAASEPAAEPAPQNP